jgi:spoIIIJ-associated protein
MKAEDAAKKVLDTMLGHLGFTATIDLEQDEEGPCLQISTAQSEWLIGDEGDRLDDLQYLVNRLLRKHYEDAPRIKVDCAHFRRMQEEKLRAEVRQLAEKVKGSGKPFQMRPLNAYYRRLVYQALLDDPQMEAHSPEGTSRLKRITLKLKSNEAP